MAIGNRYSTMSRKFENSKLFLVPLKNLTKNISVSLQISVYANDFSGFIKMTPL